MANPQLAFQGWRPPRLGSVDHATYEHNCRQLGLQVVQVAGPQGAARGAAAVIQEEEMPPFPAMSCAGAAEGVDPVKCCVPEQPGWIYGYRPEVTGTQFLVGAMVAEQLEAAASVGSGAGKESAAGRAAATRVAARNSSVGPASASSGGSGVLWIQVLATLGRDQDILDELMVRQIRTGAAAAGAAAAMVPFHSFTARSVQRRQAEEWLEGRLLVWLDMCLPRDQDLVQQLMARSAVVSEALQAKRDSRSRRVAWSDEQPSEVEGEEAIAGVSPALIDGSELAAKVASCTAS